MGDNPNKDNKLGKETPEMEEYKFEGVGLTTREKHSGEDLFNKYKQKHHVENLSDLQLLSELVFREIIQIRIKKKIGKLAKDKKKGKDDKETKSETVPTYLFKALDENLEQILILKEKLGLFAEKKEDEYKAFEILEKKFDIWKKNHLEERKVTCPFCSKIFFLNIRTDKFKESKLELFKNKVLCNEHLWICYKEGKITKDDMAKVLNVSEDYIDWLEEKIYNKPSK